MFRVLGIYNFGTVTKDYETNFNRQIVIWFVVTVRQWSDPTLEQTNMILNDSSFLAGSKMCSEGTTTFLHTKGKSFC